MSTNIIISVITIVLVFGVFWAVYKRRIMLHASRLLKQVYAVWAALGPFEGGDASATAMRYANLAVRGRDLLAGKEFKEAILKHARAYDADPARWEALRQQSLSEPKNEKFEDQLAMAEQMATNDAALRAFGTKLLCENSDESKELVAFLFEIHRIKRGKCLENPIEIGFLYAQMYTESNANPKEEIYQKFRQLNERWKGAMAEAR